MPINEAGGNGSVFFSVATNGGEIRYTRNGNFTLDQQGFLTTAAGHYVLDENGATIQLGNDNFSVQPDGSLYQDERYKKK